MIEERDLFEQAVRRFPPPERSLERLVARRDRKQRNKRITAGVVALIVALAGIGTVVRAFDASPRTPAAPTPSPLASNGDLTFVGRDSSDSASIYLADPGGGAPRKAPRQRLPGRCSATRRRARRCIEAWTGHPMAPASCTRSVGAPSDAARGGAERWDLRDGDRNRADQPAHVDAPVPPVSSQTDVEWSPDGSRIAYTQAAYAGCDSIWSFTGSCSIYTMNADGTDRVKLPTGSVVDPVTPSWSPDGTRIAFSARVGEEWFVYTLALDGSEPIRLAADLPSPEQNQPAWSPDGSRIAFLLEGTGSKAVGLPFELWSMAPDGSERRFLVAGCCMHTFGLAVQGPEWSPDSTQILILEGGGKRLEEIDASTGRRSFGEKAYGPIAWRPVP